MRSAGSMYGTCCASDTIKRPFFAPSAVPKTRVSSRLCSSKAVAMPIAVASGPDHIVLRVVDPLKSVEWYQNTLGLEPVRVEEFKAGEHFVLAEMASKQIIGHGQALHCALCPGVCLASSIQK